MRFMIATAASALILAAALPAAAQTEATAPTTSKSTSPASATTAGSTSSSASAYGSAPSASASGADTAATATSTLAAGLPVKDNTGAVIGSVSDVKADAAGNKVATIKMGTDTFAVDGANVAVQSGAVVINATQAEIKDMVKKSAKPAG